MDMNQYQDSILNSIDSNIDDLKKIHNYIVNQYMLKWRRKHLLVNDFPIIGSIAELLESDIYKRVGNWAGQEPLETLDRVQEWFEKLAVIMNNMITLIDDLRKYACFNTDKFKKIYVKINGQFKNLVLSSYVIEEQPPQIMKTKTKYVSFVLLN